MKKPVIRSSLDRLPLHQKQMIWAMLTTGGRDAIGIPLDEAVKRLREEHGIKTSTGGLSRFYHRQFRSQAPSAVTTFDPAAKTLTVIIHLSR